MASMQGAGEGDSKGIMVEDEVEVDEKVTLNVALIRCVVKSYENGGACSR